MEFSADDSVQVKAMDDLCRGYSCYKNKGYFKANEFLNSSLEYFTNDIKVLFFSGLNYSERGLYDSALARFDEILLNKPDFKKAYYERGWVYYSKCDTLLALNDFNKAIELDTNYFDAIFGRAYLYKERMKNYKLAIKDFDKLILMEPDYNYIFKYRGEAYLGAGDTGKALTDLYASINYDFDNFEGCYSRGNIFLDLNRYDDAIRDFTQAIKLDPGNYEYYYSRGTAYSMCNDYINAINDYNECIKIYSENAGILNNLAYSHLELKEYEEAYKNFKRALLCDAFHFDSMLGLAILCFEQNEKKACLKYIKKAIETAPILKKGMKGIEKLEKSGYFWSFRGKECLNKIFRMAGYFSYEEKKNHLGKGNRRPETIVQN